MSIKFNAFLFIGRLFEFGEKTNLLFSIFRFFSFGRLGARSGTPKQKLKPLAILKWHHKQKHYRIECKVKKPILGFNYSNSNFAHASINQEKNPILKRQQKHSHNVIDYFFSVIGRYLSFLMKCW